MALTAVTLTNPGAETGNTTGWTVSSGALAASTTSPHSGTYKFKAGSSPIVDYYQTITIDAGLLTAVDAGTAAAQLLAWHICADTDEGYLYLHFYASDGTTLLDSAENVASSPAAWTQEELTYAIPANTRYIRIGTYNDRVYFDAGLDSDWDDFELNISDDVDTDFPADVNAYQLGAYALGSYPAEATKVSQLGGYTLSASETSSGLFLTKAHQLGAYALVRGLADRQDLRAWPFVQDDHIFYVLQLGNIGTLVYDKLTGQWAKWASPGYAYWRGEDGVAWEGLNVCCDTENGTLWEIDADNRLDEGTTVITSKIVGGLPSRMRKHIPCYMAELSCSQTQPAAAGTSISLRTSDDEGYTWTLYGSVDGEATGTSTLFRWYGLGLIPAPGRVFELTNVGYARRINGFNVELGGDLGDN